MVDSVETQTQTLACPDCGKTFDGARATQALGGHRFRAHGIQSGSAKAAQRRAQSKPTPIVEQQQQQNGSVIEHVRGQLQQLADPLREQMTQIDERLTRLDSEVRELREARSEIRRVLEKIDPSVTPKQTKQTKSASTSANGSQRLAAERFEQKIEAVKAIITSEPEWQEGFTSNIVADTLTSRVPHGLSSKSARAVLDALRERGIVRHDRVVKGGGMQFKLTNGSAENGASEDDTQTT